MKQMPGKQDFWEGERCEYCKGRIVGKTVDLARKVRGRYILIENAHVGVCMECGTRYYPANFLKTVEETARRRPKAKREVRMPVYSL
jgi:YgiT-type zinc finger domain-containing protein